MATFSELEVRTNPIHVYELPGEVKILGFYDDTSCCGSPDLQHCMAQGPYYEVLGPGPYGKVVLTVKIAQENSGALRVDL